MKKIINNMTQIVALIVVLAGAVYVFAVLLKAFPTILLIVNSQFFASILTFIVGSIAYVLYLQQKIDHKRNIANLILQEIRYAEQRLREARDRKHVYLLSDKLLPTNSWHSNIHLFISILEENQVDTISRFYSRVEFLDHLIREIANEKAFPKNTNSGNPIIVQPSMPFQQGNPSISQAAPQPSHIQFDFSLATQAAQILDEVSKEIELIYNSSAVDSLRRVATK